MCSDCLSRCITEMPGYAVWALDQGQHGVRGTSIAARARNDIPQLHHLELFMCEHGLAPGPAKRRHFNVGRANRHFGPPSPAGTEVLKPPVWAGHMRSACCAQQTPEDCIAVHCTFLSLEKRGLSPVSVLGSLMCCRICVSPNISIILRLVYVSSTQLTLRAGAAAGRWDGLKKSKNLCTRTF